MTDKEKKELEELRKFKAEMEEKAKAPAIPPLDERILADYNKGIAPVDIARRHTVSVEKVLELTGNTDLFNVSVIGDQVDPSEIGQQGTFNPGVTYQVKYTVN